MELLNNEYVIFLAIFGMFAVIAEPFDQDALRSARSVNLPPFE